MMTPLFGAMRRLWRVSVLGLTVLAWTTAAQAQDAAFDPRSYRQVLAGDPTQVLVLGTPHLSGAPDNFDPGDLEPLLARLEAFAPDIITIEALSGESVVALRAFRGIYLESPESFGQRIFAVAALAQAGTNLDMAEAETAARQALAALGDDPTPAQRRRLSALFATAGDPHSALVQWRRLPMEDRDARDGVLPELIHAFAAYDTRRNENHLIGVELAVRLGLERVYPVDDHAGDDIMYARMDALLDWFDDPERVARMETPEAQHIINASQRLTSPDQVMTTYREMNSPAGGWADADLQWRMLLEAETPGDIARRRMAEWETRNLRIAAHIREAAANAPGGRILVIIGGAHKPWLDAYLGLMTDIDVVDAEVVLR